LTIIHIFTGHYGMNGCSGFSATSWYFKNLCSVFYMRSNCNQSVLRLNFSWPCIFCKGQ